MHRHGPVVVQCTDCVVFPVLLTNQLQFTDKIMDKCINLASCGPFRLAQFAPWSESAIRTLANLLPGQFVPWNFSLWPFRSLARSLPRTFAPRNESSRERTFLGMNTHENESSRAILLWEQKFQGVRGPGSERNREQKGQGVKVPGS